MKRATIDRLRRALLGTGLLGSLLLLASCGVTEPSNEGWQDVSEFSWPTEIGTTMTFRKSETQSGSISDIYLDIEAATPDPTNVTPYGRLDLVLVDTSLGDVSMVHFLSTSDLLVVRKEKFGGDPALLLKSPLEKGHRWYSSSDSLWEAEVVDVYSLRKIEGTLYEDVVAVRYRRTDVVEQEYIRFYAKGIGEVMTIENSFIRSTSSTDTSRADLIPQLEEKRVLIATQPAS